MSSLGLAIHPVARQRAQRDWSQAELARRTNIPRTTISAIEANRLTPSVCTALVLARTFECSVEELFGEQPPASSEPEWAWRACSQPCRYWEAELDGRRLLYPVESLSLNTIPHDGVWQNGAGSVGSAERAATTLVIASCDPAAGLLAGEYARASGFRLIVISRGGGEAMDLLKRRLIHMAGLHRSTRSHPEQNTETVRTELGEGYRLVHMAEWEAGLALAPGNSCASLESAARTARRWALREQGSAARECLDQLRTGARGRTVRSHGAVAEAVRDGWADAGVCVRLSAEEAGVNFIPVRTETLDLCFPSALERDRRIQALIRLLGSRSHRRLIGSLPGYDVRCTGEVLTV